MVRSAEHELISLVGEVQTEAPLGQSCQPHHQIMRVRILPLPVDPQLAFGASGAGGQQTRVSSAIPRGIDVLSIINVAIGPVDLFHLLQGFEVPELQLLLGGVAACEDGAVLVV